jgi:hypothetical protein
MKPVGEPDAGKRHVRFDERGWETERCRMAQATAPILDSTESGHRADSGRLPQRCNPGDCRHSPNGIMESGAEIDGLRNGRRASRRSCRVNVMSGSAHARRGDAF